MKNRMRVTQSKNYRKKSTFSKSCIDVNVKNKSIAESVLSKKRDLLSVQKYSMKFSVLRLKLFTTCNFEKKTRWSTSSASSSCLNPITF